MTRSAVAEPNTRDTAHLLRRFWSYASVYRRWIWIGLLMIPVVAAMTALRPLLLKHAIDVDLQNADPLGLRVTGLAFMVAVVAEFLAQATQVYAFQRAGHASIGNLRRSIFEHVLRLPARFFDMHPVGGLLTRSTSDVEAVSDTLSLGVVTIVTDIVMIASILVAMFSLSVPLSLASLVVAPILVVLVRYFSAALRRLQLETRRAHGIQVGYLAEQLAGITVVQLFGRERAASAEYQRLGQRYLRATKLANIYDALLYSLMDGIGALCIAVLLYFAAGSLAHDSGVTLGLLFAFVDYLQRIFVPIREFSGKLATIQRATASLERIYGLLDTPAEPRRFVGPDPLTAWRGGLRIRDLWFRYRDDGPDVLKGISFDVAPGEVVAIVGRTGSGKTSLGRVLTRFYEGYRGSVEFVLPDGGRELRELDPISLRHHLLMVQQDVFLFDADVAYNVALGDPAVRDQPDKLEAALRTVQADTFLRERGGTSYHVGERGKRLSAGEAQLVAFARVAARSPDFLVLDEATASVDSLTEARVQAAIEQLFRGRSAIVIAHRLSTVRRADKILVLKAGQIVEQGNHETLLASGGMYAELHRAGFRDPEGSEAPGHALREPYIQDSEG